MVRFRKLCNEYSVRQQQGISVMNLWVLKIKKVVGCECLGYIQ